MARSCSTIELHLQMAVQTGLEPATPSVTGRYANQLRHWTSYLICFLLCSLFRNNDDYITKRMFNRQPMELYFENFKGNFSCTAGQLSKIAGAYAAVVRCFRFFDGDRLCIWPQAVGSSIKKQESSAYSLLVFKTLWICFNGFDSNCMDCLKKQRGINLSEFWGVSKLEKQKRTTRVLSSTRWSR